MQTRFILALGAFLLCCGDARTDQQTVYEGVWRTTNRKLDGTMTCIVKELGNEKWQGRFYGVWQGTAFDYSVNFTGPPSKLRGSAVIDGASYEWTGEISPESRTFAGKFGGSRYTGDFDLKRKKSIAKVAE